LYGKQVVVAVCGIGKVNAAICTQTMILKYPVNIILNTGIAGGMSPKIKIGDIVIGSALVQHDMDTSSLGDPLGFIFGINRVEIPSSDILVERLEKVAKKIQGLKVHKGIIATGDQFIGDKEKLYPIVDRFGAIACEMEGASIAQVCYVNQVDFAVVRSISDNADSESTVDFMEFQHMAAKNSIEMIKHFLIED
jgi:adenosylhomocysteine nucleosidase